MPIRVIKVSELKRPTRQKESIIETLEEFTAAKTKLQHGLSPQEAIEIEIKKSSERGRKHLKATFKKRMREYLSSLGLLQDYSVSTWSDRDNDYIQIAHEPALATTMAQTLAQTDRTSATSKKRGSKR